MGQTICILAAGRGSRVGTSAGRIHKALLPVGNQAVISRIIGQFADDAAYVIALGHQGEQVRDYLALAHPGLHVTFVQVDRIDGPGSGPGRSLLACRGHLNAPFIMTSCDTLVTLPPVLPAGNWMGVAPVDDPRPWCTVDVGTGGQIRALHDKSADGSRLAFIGIAGVRDVDVFWDALWASGGNDSFEVAAGFCGLIARGLSPAPMAWRDTGSTENYLATAAQYGRGLTFAGKANDITYRIGDRSVKFFNQPEIARRRFVRGRAHAPAFAPVIGQHGNFLACRFIAGTPLGECLDGTRARAVLNWLEEDFWRPGIIESAAFADLCQDFYDTKTRRRLADFLSRHTPDGGAGPDGEAGTVTINGIVCAPVGVLLDELRLHPASGVPSTFHGDLHADNIIVGVDGSHTLIDWREDFGGSLDVGDRIYDLAKFFHTLDFSVGAMAGNGFRMDRSGDRMTLQHVERPGEREAAAVFWQHVAERGYDAARIRIVNALIFINMAPLYDVGLGTYLYYLGRLRLAEALFARAVAA